MDLAATIYLFYLHKTTTYMILFLFLTVIVENIPVLGISLVSTKSFHNLFNLAFLQLMKILQAEKDLFQFF